MASGHGPAGLLTGTESNLLRSTPLNFGLAIAIGIAVAGMILRIASLRELSPLGEQHRKRIRNGLAPLDPRHYTPKGRRYLTIARALLLMALVVAVLSVMLTNAGS